MFKKKKYTPKTIQLSSPSKRIYQMITITAFEDSTSQPNLSQICIKCADGVILRFSQQPNYSLVPRPSPVMQW